METSPIKLMLMSLGGTPDPLIKSINRYEPEKIIFLASHNSVPISHTILSTMVQKPTAEFVITEDPNSLYECYTKALECIDRIRKTKIAAHEVMVDYTGGTKVMTASLLMAALGRAYRFNYVGGKLRDKEGLGPVMTGHEIMFTEASPWAVFAEEERRQIVALFNSRRFSAVTEIITGLDRQLPPRIEAYFNFILPLANGFLMWDQFSHKAAQRNLEKGLGHLEKYMQDRSAVELVPFLESTLSCKQYLDNLVAKIDGPNKFDHAMVTDLINNARRKMADKRFDDAAARIYRALELYGQIVFKEVAGCDNSKVKLNVIPGHLKEKFRKKYYDDYTKHLKLPLQATFEYLSAMGNEAGKRFFKKEKEIKKIQYNRNQSILAHGKTPVSEAGAKSILETVTRFVGNPEVFDFPQLP